MRLRVILIGAGFIVLALVWALLVYRPGAKKITDLRAQQDAARVELNQLEATLAHLRQLQRDEPRLRAEAARLNDAVPTDPRLPDIILQVQEAAGLAGIDFISITPSLPAAFTGPPGASTATAGAGPLQAITLSVGTTGRYFEIEDFVRRMERLRRATRINSFGLAGGASVADASASPGGSPLMSVTFQMQMFVAGAAPVQTPTTITASPTPAPGAGSPVPSPSPAGGR